MDIEVDMVFVPERNDEKHSGTSSEVSTSRTSSARPMGELLNTRKRDQDKPTEAWELQTPSPIRGSSHVLPHALGMDGTFKEVENQRPFT